MKEKVIALVFVLIIIAALIALAVITYTELIRLLEESGKVSSIYDKLEYWFKSVLYLLAFSSIILLVVLIICAFIYIVILIR